MTPSATSDARRAAAAFCLAVSGPVSARKIGIAPGGSRITSSVTKVDVNSVRSTAHGSTTGVPDPCASIASRTSGDVVNSPSRFSFPSPW